MILWRIVLVHKSESRWQKNSQAWLSTSPSPTVYIRLASHVFALTFRQAWYPRLRQTNEDVSLLLKTMAIAKMAASFPSYLPPSHPHSRWTEVKAKPCSLGASPLWCCVCVYELMKMATLFYRTGTFKAACSSAEVPFFWSVQLLHEEMRVRGHSEVAQTKCGAEVWLGLV